MNPIDELIARETTAALEEGLNRYYQDEDPVGALIFAAHLAGANLTELSASVASLRNRGHIAHRGAGISDIKACIADVRSYLANYIN